MNEWQKKLSVNFVLLPWDGHPELTESNLVLVRADETI